MAAHNNRYTFIKTVPSVLKDDGLHEEIKKGLLATPKSLPYFLLYDDKGSDIFEEVSTYSVGRWRELKMRREWERRGYMLLLALVAVDMQIGRILSNSLWKGDIGHLHQWDSDRRSSLHPPGGIGQWKLLQGFPLIILLIFFLVTAILLVFFRVTAVSPQLHRFSLISCNVRAILYS